MRKWMLAVGILGILALRSVQATAQPAAIVSARRLA